MSPTPTFMMLKHRHVQQTGKDALPTMHQRILAKPAITTPACVPVSKIPSKSRPARSNRWYSNVKNNKIKDRGLLPSASLWLYSPTFGKKLKWVILRTDVQQQLQNDRQEPTQEHTHLRSRGPVHIWMFLSSSQGCEGEQRVGTGDRKIERKWHGSVIESERLDVWRQICNVLWVIPHYLFPHYRKQLFIFKCL